MADEYDFQINDLKFRAAISDKHPYQRATAPFRKEQFDSAPTVGDQSLTGWWTRGQLSFHKGAGLKYYEVLEGEAVLNRFQTSVGVDVFTPGEASMCAEPYNVTSTALNSVYDAVGVSDSGFGALIDGTLGVRMVNLSSGALTAKALSAGTGVRLTANRRNFFVSTTSMKVERFAVDADGDTPDGPIYTYTSALSGVWYAKKRLWIIARNGDVFAVTDKPAAPPVALTGPVVNVGPTPSALDLDTSLTEAPRGVYISRGSEDIYLVTLSGDGSVPTLAAPVVAATMPSGEMVMCIRYHLGHLVIVTNKGVRFGQLADDGAITYGPLVKENYPVTCRRVGVGGTSAYVILSGTVHRFDLSQPLADNPLSFAYAAMGDIPSVVYNQHGVFESGASGALIAFEGPTLRYVTGSGNRATESWIQTGYHRFGTLDPKVFHSVVVRITGTVGSVRVYQVNTAGTWTLLGTVAASNWNAVGEFTFPPGSIAERFALAFEFVADNTQSAPYQPVLLGYQIKAQPAPQRMRLLRWPLLVTDTYRTRYGKERGRAGGAYTTLKALEALESSASVVTFTDHRTGETGTAYVESVEFDSHTPSQHNNSGFGGVAQVTLRALS